VSENCLHVAADQSCGTEAATIKVRSRRRYVASVLLDYVPRRLGVILALVGAGELEAETLALVFWTNSRCLAEWCLGPMTGMIIDEHLVSVDSGGSRYDRS
jgi:hypothetical protein